MKNEFKKKKLTQFYRFKFGKLNKVIELLKKKDRKIFAKHLTSEELDILSQLKFFKNIHLKTQIWKDEEELLNYITENK